MNPRIRPIPLPMISLGFLAALILAPAALVAAGDPKGETNLVKESMLPKGKGLAAKYPGDEGIAADPQVIFADNFETKTDLSLWDEPRGKLGEVLDLVADPETALTGKRVLRVRATLGKDTGGGVTKWFEAAPAVFIRFYVKFDPECDYVHHFVTLRANKGLRGGDRWSGFGGAGLKPEGDERFSTALEPWGNWGKWKAPGRWNFYSYWLGMDKSPDGKYWGNSFLPAGQEDIQKGRWICGEFMLKENAPGKADGEQAFWIDGELRGHWKGIEWRKSPSLRANALTLETYVTDTWTKHAINTVSFDNVVFAREYIGPCSPSSSPSRR